MCDFVFSPMENFRTFFCKICITEIQLFVPEKVKSRFPQSIFFSLESKFIKKAVSIHSIHKEKYLTLFILTEKKWNEKIMLLNNYFLNEIYN